MEKSKENIDIYIIEKKKKLPKKLLCKKVGKKKKLQKKTGINTNKTLNKDVNSSLDLRSEYLIFFYEPNAIMQ